MTDQREYKRRWREEHREQVKAREKENARRRALEDLASVRHLAENVVIMRANDGREYIVGGVKSNEL